MGTSNSSITAQRLGYVLGSVLLLQAVCMAVTFLYFSSELKQIQDTFSKSNAACLTGDILDPRSGFTKDPEFYDYPSKEDPGRNKDLCRRFRAQIQQLIDKTISNRYERDMSVIVKGEVSRFLPYLTQSGSGAQPTVQKIAAHLTGDYRRNSNPMEGPMSKKVYGQKIQTWEPERGLAFLHSVAYKDGELIVPKTGHYYIYGQTYFRYREAGDSGPDGSLSHPRNKQMVQYIYKTTAYPEPILLMKNTRTTCWAKEAEYGLHSIYQGGVFELKYHDTIFVTVSNISLIDMDGGSSFFGAFLIS